MPVVPLGFLLANRQGARTFLALRVRQFSGVIMMADDRDFGTIRDLQLRVERLEGGGFGSGADARIEARIAKLESDVENIKTNMADIKTDIRAIREKADSHFLITWGGIIAVALGLAGLLAKGFKWL